MELVKKSFNKWIISAVVLVVGILCIVAGASSGNASLDAYTGISMTIGISLIVVASLSVLLSLCATILSKGDVSFGVTAIGSAATLALGILFVVDNGLGGTLIWILLNYVPYLMLVAGSIVALDAILLLVFSLAKKTLKVNLMSIIAGIIIAAITILFGALMVGNDPIISKNAQLIIFGIILILYALLLCAITFIPLFAAKTVITVAVKDVTPEESTNDETNVNEEKAE